MIKTLAIVLRARRFSESSLTAVLFGRDHGRLDVLAKGCRREKSPLFGHLDLYQKEDVLILERPQSGLDLLIEAAFADEHTGLRLCPPAFAAAGFLADFTAEVIMPGDPQPALFDALAGALQILSGLGEPAARAGLAAPQPFTREERNILIGRTVKLALLDMLRHIGFGLELRRCVRCGAGPANAEGTAGGWSVSARAGGALCHACRAKAADAAIIRSDALAALGEQGGNAERLELSLHPAERRRWLRFLIDYSQHMLEKPLKGKAPLLQILAPLPQRQ